MAVADPSRAIEGFCRPESTTPDMVSAISRSLLAFFAITGGRGGDPNLSAFLGARHSSRTWWLSRHLMSAFEPVKIRGASSSLMAAPHAPGGPLGPQRLTWYPQCFAIAGQLS